MQDKNLPMPFKTCSKILLALSALAHLSMMNMENGKQESPTGLQWMDFNRRFITGRRMYRSQRRISFGAFLLKKHLPFMRIDPCRYYTPDISTVPYSEDTLPMAPTLDTYAMDSLARISTPSYKRNTSLIPYATDCTLDYPSYCITHQIVDIKVHGEHHHEYHLLPNYVLKVYKRVDRKVKPVPGVFPEDALVRRSIPADPLLTLPVLPTHPPDFKPTAKLTEERMEILSVNPDGFLWPEEEKLVKHILVLNEKALAFEDYERGTLREDYFSPYIIPTVEHVPWEFKNIP